MLDSLLVEWNPLSRPKERQSQQRGLELAGHRCNKERGRSAQKILWNQKENGKKEEKKKERKKDYESGNPNSFSPANITGLSCTEAMWDRRLVAIS
jgi:hypothetical protein